MATYGWATPDVVRKGITGAAGWVYYNWSRENEASFFGDKLTRSTPGYVKQEVNRILDERNKRRAKTSA